VVESHDLRARIILYSELHLKKKTTKPKNTPHKTNQPTQHQQKSPSFPLCFSISSSILLRTAEGAHQRGAVSPQPGHRAIAPVMAGFVYPQELNYSSYRTPTHHHSSHRMMVFGRHSAPTLAFSAHSPTKETTLWRISMICMIWPSLQSSEAERAGILISPWTRDSRCSLLHVLKG